MYDRTACLAGTRFQPLHHIVEQVIEDVPRVGCDFVQFGHNTVYAERLIAELAGSNDLTRFSRYFGGLIFHEFQITAGHIPVLTIRSSDLVP